MVLRESEKAQRVFSSVRVGGWEDWAARRPRGPEGLWVKLSCKLASSKSKTPKNSTAQQFEGGHCVNGVWWLRYWGAWMLGLGLLLVVCV